MLFFAKFSMIYVNIYDSTPKIDSAYGEGKFQTLMATRNNYQEYSFGNLTVTVEEMGVTKWLKLNVSNVKLIHNNTVFSLEVAYYG